MIDENTLLDQDKFISISSLTKFTKWRKVVDEYKLAVVVRNNLPKYVMIDYKEFKDLLKRVRL